MLHQNRFIHNFQHNNASDQFLSYLSPIPYSITLGFISYLFYNCYLMSNLKNPQYTHFPLIILIGRPASGKSEIIDYLQHTESAERINRFHIAELDILDDFPMLYTWFEEDQILEDEFGKPRLHTEPDEYFKYDYLWDLLIKRLELEYQKRVRDIPAYHEHTTTIIEFSRGAEHGGYTQAFQQFSSGLLQSASVLYVDVPYAKSLRKNRLRLTLTVRIASSNMGFRMKKLSVYTVTTIGKFSAALIRITFKLIQSRSHMRSSKTRTMSPQVHPVCWAIASNYPKCFVG